MYNIQMWRQCIISKRESYERKLGADLGPLIDAVRACLRADGESLGTKGLSKKRVMGLVKDVVMASEEAITLLDTAATTLSLSEEGSITDDPPASAQDVVVEDVSTLASIVVSET